MQAQVAWMCHHFTGALHRFVLILYPAGPSHWCYFPVKLGTWTGSQGKTGTVVRHCCGDQCLNGDFVQLAACLIRTLILASLEKFLKWFMVIWNKLNCRYVVGKSSTDHIPTTYRPRTDHIPTTYRPSLPTTYRQFNLFHITVIHCWDA